MQDSVPAGYRRGLPSCPTCGRDENVLAVPAVYEGSKAVNAAITRARATLADEDASESAKAEARETLASTPPPRIRSEILAPAPQSKAAGCGCLAVLVGVPAIAMWIVATTIHQSTETLASGDDGQHRALVTAAVSLTVLTAVMLLGMVVGLLRYRSISAGRPAADAVWRRAWYCTRCAVVHFAPGEEPAGVLPGQPLDHDTFRHVVWTAGGYGDKVKPTRL